MREISKRVQERRVKVVWTCHEKGGRIRGKRVMRIDVEGRRREGRPERKWMNSVEVD